MKFNKGNRVICNCFGIDNLKGTVIGIDENSVFVQFDQHIGGHGGHGKLQGKFGYCYFVGEKDISYYDDIINLEL